MSTVTDDYSPIYQGDTGAAFNAQFNYTNGNVFDLTGVTLGMRIVDEAGNGRNGTGSWNISNAAQGQAQYQYSAQDVAVIGNLNLYISIMANGEVRHVSKPLEILPLP